MHCKLAWWMGLLFGACWAQGLCALDYDYAISSSAEYTDNIRQGGIGGDDNESGTVFDAGLGFNLNTPANTLLAADVSGDFGKIWYSAGDLASEDRKNLDASLLFQPSSTNFRLAVLESLRQVAEDRRVVRTVGNRRDVNVFSVIPSYYIELSPVSRILASYSYSAIDEELDLSSRDVRTTTVGYEHRVSTRSTWSLNASRSKIEFTDTGQEFDQESAYFRWLYEGELTAWSLDLGRQSIAEGEDTDEALIAFSLDRQINNVSTIGVLYDQGYSDVVDADISNRLIGVTANEDAVFADEIAKEKRATLFYDYTRNTLGTRVSLNARQQESEESLSIGREVDDERYGVRLSTDYRFRDENYNLSPYGLGADYSYFKEEFNLDNEENRIKRISLRLDYYATSSTRVFFELISRNTAGTGPRSNADERSALVGFTFSPRGGN